jgi:hypothetical protein
VCELVRDRRRDGRTFGLPYDGFVDEQQLFLERDEPGVLHRAGLEVGERREVELVERVRDPRFGLEGRQDLGGLAQPVREPHATAAPRDAPQRDGRTRDRAGRDRRSLDDLERPDRPREQVRRQRDGRGHHHDLVSVVRR